MLPLNKHSYDCFSQKYLSSFRQCRGQMLSRSDTHMEHQNCYGTVLPDTVLRTAFLMYKCLHKSAPAYIIDDLCQVADVEARQRLLSSSSSSLIVSRTRLSTVGDRALPVAAARVWKSLPDLVTSAPSVAVFRSWLKPTCLTFLILPLVTVQCLRNDA